MDAMQMNMAVYFDGQLNDTKINQTPHIRPKILRRLTEAFYNCSEDMAEIIFRQKSEHKISPPTSMENHF